MHYTLCDCYDRKYKEQNDKLSLIIEKIKTKYTVTQFGEYMGVKGIYQFTNKGGDGVNYDSVIGSMDEIVLESHPGKKVV